MCTDLHHTLSCQNDSHTCFHAYTYIPVAAHRLQNDGPKAKDQEGKEQGQDGPHIHAAAAIQAGQGLVQVLRGQTFLAQNVVIGGVDAKQGTADEARGERPGWVGEAPLASVDVVAGNENGSVSCVPEMMMTTMVVMMMFFSPLPPPTLCERIDQVYVCTPTYLCNNAWGGPKSAMVREARMKTLPAQRLLRRNRGLARSVKACPAATI